MSGATLRTITRLIHLVGSALIGTFVYSPWSDLPWFVLLMQVGVIPVLVLSGIVMWQQGRIVKWLRARA